MSVDIMATYKEMLNKKILEIVIFGSIFIFCFYNMIFWYNINNTISAGFVVFNLGYFLFYCMFIY